MNGINTLNCMQQRLDENIQAGIRKSKTGNKTTSGKTILRRFLGGLKFEAKALGPRDIVTEYPEFEILAQQVEHILSFPPVQAPLFERAWLVDCSPPQLSVRKLVIDIWGEICRNYR